MSYVALAELVWVFDRVYKRSRAEIARTVEILLQTDGIQFENDTVVAQSLSDFRAGSADFADYLLMHDGKAAGCETTLTFDRKAARHPGFTLAA
jgi:predicted nucleic-acid-binding protein